ncbi:hypothetical protein JCM11251_000569 [Rhodosporidiobolus azoricus]
MTQSTPSSDDLSSRLQTILTRTGDRSITKGDLDDILSALASSGGPHTLALAVLSRFLNPDPSPTSTSTLRTTLDSLLSGSSSSELFRGLSALSALLQVAPHVASSLLSDPSLRSHLVDAVELISKPVGKGKAKQDDETTALVELLSLAAGQPTMRKLVRDTAGDWMESLLGEPDRVKEVEDVEKKARLKALAGVGVVKLRMGKEEPSMTGVPIPPEEERPSRWSLEQLAQLFVDLVVGSKETSDSSRADEGVLLPALEGLAYLTLTFSPSTKTIASSSAFVSALFSFAPKQPAPPTAADSARDYAIATLLDHLTAFPSRPDADTDAEHLSRLKRFAAAAAKNGQETPSLERESPDSVTSRITRIVKHDPSPVPTIRQFCLSPSLQTRRLAAKILHSLVNPQPLRGPLLQAGVARLFLSLIRQIPSPFSPSEDTPAVQGLAKLLITANPLLVLGPTASSPLLLEATTALTLPLGASASANEAVGLLPRFESLMALTNIASLDPSLTDQLARMNLRDRPIPLLLAVEELLLSSNTMVRRAATELLCNLVASDPGVEYYETSLPATPPSSSTDTSKPPSAKLHLLIALSSSPDLPTRIASTGALASLVYSSQISLALVSYPKWVEMLLGVTEDDEAGVRHRVYEVWRVMGEMVSQAGEKSLERTKAKEGLHDGKVSQRLRVAQEKEKVSELKEVVKAAREALWPSHKLPCDRSITYFRVPPLTEEEVNGLLKLASGQSKGYASYPFRHDHVDLTKMLSLFRVENPEDSELHIRSVSGDGPLTLPQVRLALLFRFFLRSYRYPSPSDNLVSLTSYRATDGEVVRTMNHMMAQGIFPFLVKVPTGESAFDPKKSLNESDPLIAARDFFDAFVVYSDVAKINRDMLDKGDALAMQQSRDLLMLVGKRVQDEWAKLPKHRMVEESSPIGWNRGTMGLMEGDRPSEGYYLITEEQLGSPSCLIA